MYGTEESSNAQIIFTIRNLGKESVRPVRVRTTNDNFIFSGAYARVGSDKGCL